MFILKFGQKRLILFVLRKQAKPKPGLGLVTSSKCRMDTTVVFLVETVKTHTNRPSWSLYEEIIVSGRINLQKPARSGLQPG